MLYTLRYRRPFGMTTVMIEARDLPTAQNVGEAWVAAQPGCRFVGVSPAIVADESILAPTDKAVVTPTPTAKVAGRVGS